MSRYMSSLDVLSSTPRMNSLPSSVASIGRSMLTAMRLGPGDDMASSGVWALRAR